MQLAASPTRSLIRREIFHLAWPVIAEQLLSTLATMVDAILVGHLDTIAVAAVGLVQQPQWLLIGLFMGLGVGVNALVARFYGAGEIESIEGATRAGFWLGLVVSGLAGVLIFQFAPSIMLAAGARPDVLPSGTILLRLLTPGMVATFWMMVMTSALRATGDTRTSMFVNLGINLLNALLAYSLIYGHFGAPRLGIVGAGIATSTARILGAAVLLGILLGRRSGARLVWSRLWQIDWHLLKRIVRVGYVSSSERMLSTVIYLLFARMVAVLGTLSVAAQTIAVAAENVSWMVGSGFLMAASAMVGQRLGARRPDQAEAVTGEALRISLVILGVLGLAFILVPGHYVAIFTGDVGVRALSSSALRIAGFTEMATGLVLVLTGTLSGAGDTKPLVLVSLIGGIVRLSMAAFFLFGMGWGLQGAWVAAGVDWIVRAGIIWFRYRKGIWKTVTV